MRNQVETIANVELGQRWKIASLVRTEASQIVELAVSLPLLVVILVGIMDFGGAFNLKHKLDIAVRETARAASNQSTADLTNPAPASIDALRQLLDGNLTAVQVNDCGLSAAISTKIGLSWTYTASTGCPGTLSLTIDRGGTFPTSGGPAVVVEATHVRVSYPYQWRFNRVMQLIVPGATYAGVSQIKTDAVMQNLN